MLNEEEGNFDPLVFWCVNGFIFLMMVMVGLWCCFADKTTWILTARGQESDQVYQQSLREREERRKQAKIESPEKRTRKLVQSFRRHKVQMVS